MTSRTLIKKNINQTIVKNLTISLTLPHTSIFKTKVSLYLMIIVLFSLSSCATKYTFLTSSIVPAAEGTAKVSEDDNSNYKIDLSVIRLVDPKRLTPPKNYYVTWMKTENGEIKNLGQLKTESSFFSKTLKSSLETVTSFKPLGFFITTEDETAVQFPGEQIVLRTN